MATSQTCCHLPGKMLNSAAECADRARICGSYERRMTKREKEIKTERERDREKRKEREGRRRR
jgi:hypothetical protein